ncbi:MULTISPECIES: MBL fold metallo-hydrolase [unclassified Clostridium]|uniref:MBL fold metallo-hydrolase n=1 Tax=unclassified Clostridium TaxID=2614128 RepID=UPI0002973996|nr:MULTISPECIES: MBL fold metallo-hydrolase [unclassified Clostridium]EKQ54479.1 MAG: metal-dependent hydrolase, beta-lactamase superfamily III [Clostridium sp. Maddingley MBC34-26]
MNKLNFLGRGSGYNTKEGNTSAYIIKNETLLLIDCGETVFKTIVEKKLVDGIKNIYLLVTHMHSDHIGSIGSFIGFCFWKYKIVTKLYFYETDKMRKFLELVGLIENQSFIIIDENTRISELGLEFQPSLTKHSMTVKTYSYTLKFDEGNDIFFSGDTYETNIEVISFLKEGNLIYHDTCLDDYAGNMHTSLRVLSEIIPKEYRKQVYCMHIDGENFVERAQNEGFNVVDI